MEWSDLPDAVKSHMTDLGGQECHDNTIPQDNARPQDNAGPQENAGNLPSQESADLAEEAPETDMNATPSGSTVPSGTTLSSPSDISCREARPASGDQQAGEEVSDPGSGPPGAEDAVAPRRRQ